jgi:hypothetical protein
MISSKAEMPLRMKRAATTFSEFGIDFVSLMAFCCRTLSNPS